LKFKEPRQVSLGSFLFPTPQRAFLNKDYFSDFHKIKILFSAIFKAKIKIEGKIKIDRVGLI